MKRMMITTGLCIVMTASTAVKVARAGEEKPPLIQIAILLDTSGSMRGLIGQAKEQLWTIVNEFVTMKRNGKVPELHVALYEYGKSSIPASEGYLRMILPLTTDLDKVSEELFALTTNGGQEYCGKVIKAATEGLAWSRSNDDFKAIYIAGNEPFTQGDIDYRKACPAAVAKSIVVNTIHCGGYDQGVSGKWKDGAMLADGSYMNIDQNRKVVHIEAPQDKEIARLGEEMNKTYIPYGAMGKAGAANQIAQDSNAGSVSKGSNVQRQVAKASAQYRNDAWDLVDAAREGKVKLDELKDKDLPENMRKMNAEQRKAYVETQTKQRAQIQQSIKELNDARKKYVAAEMKKRVETGEDTLDAAIVKAIRSQAVKKNFKYASPPGGSE